MPPAGWESAATRAAEKWIEDQGISGLPIDPFAIAEALEIGVQPLPPTSRGVSGLLLRQGEVYGIMYATYIDNEGFQRFCVAHELAHYLLPGHPESVLDAGGVHRSRAGFVSNDRHELEADHFAAGLLMPRPLFTRAMDGAGEGLDAVDFLADACVTSLTATAIRYVHLVEDPIAMVMSTGKTIDYCVMSEALRQFRGIEWLRKNTPLPKASRTFIFNHDPRKVAHGERDSCVVPLQDWFGGRGQYDVLEEIVGLGRYEKTLTILTVEDAPGEEEVQDEEELIESWTPRFRRR